MLQHEISIRKPGTVLIFLALALTSISSGVSTSVEIGSNAEFRIEIESETGGVHRAAQECTISIAHCVNPPIPSGEWLRLTVWGVNSQAEGHGLLTVTSSGGYLERWGIWMTPSNPTWILLPPLNELSLQVDVQLRLSNGTLFGWKFAASPRESSETTYAHIRPVDEWLRYQVHVPNNSDFYIGVRTVGTGSTSTNGEPSPYAFFYDVQDVTKGAGMRSYGYGYGYRGSAVSVELQTANLSIPDRLWNQLPEAQNVGPAFQGRTTAGNMTFNVTFGRANLGDGTLGELLWFGDGVKLALVDRGAFSAQKVTEAIGASVYGYGAQASSQTAHVALPANKTSLLLVGAFVTDGAEAELTITDGSQSQSRLLSSLGRASHEHSLVRTGQCIEHWGAVLTDVRGIYRPVLVIAVAVGLHIHLPLLSEERCGL